MLGGAGAGPGLGGGMALTFAVLAIGYLLTLISLEVPLPVPRGMYYFRPNSTQALLLEGRRLDEQMMLAAATQKQKALAAAEAMLLQAATEEEEEGHNPHAAPRDLSVMAASADSAAAAFALNYSRALMVYDLVFEESDQWLEDVVDRVQLWNKLFLRQRKAKNWLVSLRPQEHADSTAKALARRKALQKEWEWLDEAEQQAAITALEAKEEAAATAKDFLQSIVEEKGKQQARGSGGDDDEDYFTAAELDVLTKLFLSHEAADGATTGARGKKRRQQDEDGFKPVPVHIFFAADNGTYSGTHELTYILAAMRYKTDLRVPERASAHSIETCVDATFGFFKRPVRNALTVNITHHQPVPVLAVTTGIYSTRAAACVAYVLSLPMFDIQSITFMGTAGVSPVVGGGGWHPESTPFASPQAAESSPSHAVSDSLRRLQLTPEYAHAQSNLACQSEWAPSSTKVALGSVCVTYAALLQECGICHEEMPVASLCSRPRCAIHNSSTFFGPCNFKLSHSGRRLSEAMKGSMVGREFPPVPPIVRAGMERFWAANEALPKYRAIRQDQDVALFGDEEQTKKAGGAKRGGADAQDNSANTGKEEEAEEDDEELVYEYLRDAPAKPILLNCAEVDTSQILAGVRSDALCREYAYTLLHDEAEPEDWEARKRQIRREKGEETQADAASAKRLREIYPRSDLTCVQAMEGFGFLHVLVGSQFPHIPVALVRAASNYDMYPLRKIVRPVSLDGLSTREEVLAQLRDGKGKGDEEKEGGGGGSAPATALDVDGMPLSKSVGASGRKLRQLFANDNFSADFATRARLRMTAEDVAEAQEMERASAAQRSSPLGTTLESEYYYVGWEQNTAFMSVEEYDRYTKASYQYAVETSSAVVLNFFLRDDSRVPGKVLQKP